MTRPQERLELTVLKHLARGRTLVWTATAVELMPKDVREIAKRHGACRNGEAVDPAAAAHAALELTQRLGDTIPAREPAAPAPAARPKPRPAAAAPAVDGALQRVPIGQVRPDPDNPRRDVGDVSELAASLAEVGMLQPIVVRRCLGGLVVVAGHRRLAAARAAGWDTVPVIVHAPMRDDEVLAAMLIENGHRRDLDPIEEARGLARLKGQLGCTETQLARRIGRHQTHVSARLRLLALPLAEQEELRRGDMTLTEAKDRARLASGRIGAQTGRPGVNHFSTAHPLAAAAKARCVRLQHDRGRGKGVGGIACGACWESVLRADERAHLHELSGRRGACALCDRALPAGTTTPVPANRTRSTA